MTPTDYWREAVETSLDEMGVSLTAEQVNELAECMQGCHENYGLAFYQPSSPYPTEMDRLKKELRSAKDTASEVPDLKQKVKDQRERIRDLVWKIEELVNKIQELRSGGTA